MTRVARLERLLALPAADARFSEDELAGLTAPVAGWFRSAIAPGTPLHRAARIEMRGRIRLRGWTPFHGREVVAPEAGFVWAVRAGAISGFDRYSDGSGEMRWRLLGVVPVMRASGIDVTRSAAARAAGEGMWVPTALLPRFGVRWEAGAEGSTIVSHQTLGGEEITYRHTLDERGRVTSSVTERWGDPDRTGTWALHHFGVEHSAWGTFAGLTIPTAGRAGWHVGTDRQAEGMFFEYKITDLRPVA